MKTIHPHPYIHMDGVLAVEQEVSDEDAARLVKSGAFTYTPAVDGVPGDSTLPKAKVKPLVKHEPFHPPEPVTPDSQPEGSADAGPFHFTEE